MGKTSKTHTKNNEQASAHRQKGITPMTAQKPVYSRPSGDDPMPAPKRKRRRKRGHTTDTHHTRNQRTHRREKRRARELRAENEKLHRRLAAIYDALSLD